jgi:hypothetical protein
LLVCAPFLSDTNNASASVPRKARLRPQFQSLFLSTRRAFRCVLTCGNAPLEMVERRRARERRTAERASRKGPQNAGKGNGNERGMEMPLRRTSTDDSVSRCRTRGPSHRRPAGVVDDQHSLMSWVRRRAAKTPLTCGFALVGDAGREVALLVGHLVPLLVPPLASPVPDRRRPGRAPAADQPQTPPTCRRLAGSAVPPCASPTARHCWLRLRTSFERPTIARLSAGHSLARPAKSGTAREYRRHPRGAAVGKRPSRAFPAGRLAG